MSDRSQYSSPCLVAMPQNVNRLSIPTSMPYEPAVIDLQMRMALPLSCVLNDNGAFVARTVPLSRPTQSEDSSPHPQRDRILLGTQDFAGIRGRHSIIGVSCDLKEFDCEVLVFTHPIPDHLRDIHWIGSHSAICAHGSTIAAVQIDDDFCFNKIDYHASHTDWVRELAPHPIRKDRFASGGFDGFLCINNVNRRECCVRKVNSEGVISSIRWGANHNSISLTTDLGMFSIYDARTAMSSPDVVADSHKLMLYAHDWLDNHTIMMGFGDGELLRFDMRNGKFLSDPSMSAGCCIGDITIRDGIAMVSGETNEIALWRTNSMNLLECFAKGSPAIPGVDPGPSSSSCPCATFGSDGRSILTADSLGVMACFDFDIPR